MEKKIDNLYKLRKGDSILLDGTRWYVLNSGGRVTVQDTPTPEWLNETKEQL